MGVQNYPNTATLMLTFLDDVKRHGVNRISGLNPTLINFNGKQIYVYIKNLSPAQLSNNNPDIWRIQLPKRDEFDDIKKSDKLFILFGYDYKNKVYTTWNPYWCKQRLNVAESCSMYSRYSLQKRVADTQKIEKMQLQNEGDVVCIPNFLLGSYLNKIKDYYPEESVYIPIGSSIQKRKTEEKQPSFFQKKSGEEILFEEFKGLYNIEEYREYLNEKGYPENTVSNYSKRLAFVFDNGFLEKHEDVFLEYIKLEDYNHAINKFCYKPDIRYYVDVWNKDIIFSLKHYLLFVEKKLYGTQNIRIRISDEYLVVCKQDSQKESQKGYIKVPQVPNFKLDQFGKLVSLDSDIIEQLTPQVRGVDYPDYNSIIIKIKKYYPEKVTEKMTPADWMKLFESTKWGKKRGRKAGTQIVSNKKVESVEEVSFNKITSNEIKNYIKDSEVTSEIINKEISGIKNIDYKKLETVFDKKITSYKYFWFIAIISLAKERDKLTISNDEILIRMASLAWPIVMNDGIDLGERDMLLKLLKQLQRITYIISSASKKIVESTLTDYYEISEVKDILAPLLNNVPYRFLSPWVKFTNNDEVINISNSDGFKGLYALNSDGIVINSEWKDYITSHYTELCEFAFKSFIGYVKQYNNDLKLLKLMRSGWGI